MVRISERNRIISGLSQGVVVIERRRGPGRCRRRDMHWRKPGGICSTGVSPTGTSKGTNRLIKEGARLLTSVEDIFAELPG